MKLITNKITQHCHTHKPLGFRASHETSWEAEKLDNVSFDLYNVRFTMLDKALNVY